MREKIEYGKVCVYVSFAIVNVSFSSIDWFHNRQDQQVHNHYPEPNMLNHSHIPLHYANLKKIHSILSKN
jgi:hypothetical protein